MIVLGVHGWAGTHDAAAALVVDGRVVACVEEERLVRRKHAVGMRPQTAVQSVLDIGGLSIEDVDVVTCGWDLPRYAAAHRAFGAWNRDDAAFVEAVVGSRPRRTPPVEWVGHHLAHAASTFYPSGFDRAAVLIVDGQGEDRSLSLFEGGHDGLRLVRDWGPACSLGLLYEAATLHCGFNFLDAGKTMGLAAYGQRPQDPLPIAWQGDDFSTPVPDGVEEDDVTAAWAALFAERFGPPPSPRQCYDPLRSAMRWEHDDPAAHAPDVAAAAQDAVERCMTDIVRYAVAEVGSDHVALAGGVALNCVANGLLRRECASLFIPPTAHDAGVALGAALLISAQAGDPVTPVQAADLGPSFDTKAVSAVLEAAKLRAFECDDPAVEAALRLARGEVIGWVQGRMEVGPRALGRRSILARPDTADVKDRVNRIKGRELWRPLAPSVALGQAPELFDIDGEAPFMLLSVDMTDEGRRRVPAVAHVDGSTRVQTVADDDRDPYSRLLRAMGDETGDSVVLNTSFNAPGEPIVCTPADAIRTYSTMGLDALILGDFVLVKD